MRKNHLIYTVFLFCLLLNSCGFLEQRLNVPTAAPAKSQPIQEKSVRTAAKPPRSDNKFLRQKQQIHHLLEGTDFLAALDLIRQEVGRGIGEKELQEEYLSALNGVIDQGEAALIEHHPEQAGLLFRAALDHFPKAAELSRNADLTPSALNVKINLCVDKLMENGIIAYRVGNLGKAIEEWQKISSFYPQHQASQKAIRTANVQLANLKKIESDQ